MSTKHRIYEMIYLVNRDASDEDRERLHARLESTITADFDGQVLSSESWGKRRLAFEILKHAEGIYAVLEITCEPATVAELDRQLGLNESVLRTKVLRREPKKKRVAQAPATTPVAAAS